MKKVVRLSRSGGLYIVLALLLGAISVNTANNLLYLVTALMLAYLLASGVVGRRNILTAEISFVFPDEIYAGTPCLVRARVTNRGRAPLFLIEASLGGKAGQNLLFPLVQPGQTLEQTSFVTFLRRGRAGLPAAELFSLYPFGFFKRYGRLPAVSVVVFPSPVACETGPLFAKNELSCDPAAAAPMSDADVVGVRDYAEGDSMKMIHWKSSARTGKLKSRLYENNAVSQARVLDLDELVRRGRERGLSMAAFAVCESMKSGLPIGLKSRGQITPPAAGRAHMLALLAQLALYGTEHGDDN